MFLDKDIILRMTPDLIKVYGAKRSRGVAFEIAKSQMAKISVLGGVKANIYVSSRDLGPNNDNMISDSNELLPGFVSLLSKDEVDAEYDERRRRREEKNLMKPQSEPLSSRVMLPKKKIEIKRAEQKISTEQEESILSRIKVMNIDVDENDSDNDDGRMSDSSNDNEDEEDRVIDALKSEVSTSYTFAYKGSRMVIEKKKRKRKKVLQSGEQTED
jgi:hypothetical protein